MRKGPLADGLCHPVELRDGMSGDGDLSDPARFLGHRAKRATCDIQPALLGANLSPQRPSLQPAVHIRIICEPAYLVLYLVLDADVACRPANTQRGGPKLL